MKRGDQSNRNTDIFMNKEMVSTVNSGEKGTMVINDHF